MKDRSDDPSEHGDTSHSELNMGNPHLTNHAFLILLVCYLLKKEYFKEYWPTVIYSICNNAKSQLQELIPKSRYKSQPLLNPMTLPPKESMHITYGTGGTQFQQQVTANSNIQCNDHTASAIINVHTASAITNVHTASAITNVHTASAITNVHTVSAITNVHTASAITNVHTASAITNVHTASPIPMFIQQVR